MIWGSHSARALIGGSHKLFELGPWIHIMFYANMPYAEVTQCGLTNSRVWDWRNKIL